MSREVLSPPLMRMGINRCYRVNVVHEDFGGRPEMQSRQPDQVPYEEPDLYGEDDDDDVDVEELPHGIFKISLIIAPAFYGGIIGFKGVSRRRIETENQVEISVPPRVAETTKKNEYIVIKGKTRSGVCAARRKILLLVNTLRARMKPTHFVSVPLANESVKQKYNNFKLEVMACKFPGIDESSFMEPGCLHLTLVTCCLLNDLERAQGVEVLQSCRDFLKGIRTPLHIKVRGLEIMNDDPSSVRVLYARVESEDLQQLADNVAQRFKEKNLFCDKIKRDSVKLHMTLLNTRYQEGSQQSTKLDVRELLKRFSDYDFGSADCNELLLCAMRSDGDSREFYKTTGSLTF